MTVAPHRPTANVSRPLNNSVTVAAPNQVAPSQASSPKLSWASASNAAAVPTLASAASSWGVNSQASGGNRTL